MSPFDEFKKAAPVRLHLTECRCPERAAYKYFVCGKGCTLGVLFEDSVSIYFEWLTHNGGCPADYPPEIRYKAWPKREFARLLRLGVWEATTSDAGAVPA